MSLLLSIVLTTEWNLSSKKLSSEKKEQKISKTKFYFECVRYVIITKPVIKELIENII